MKLLIFSQYFPPEMGAPQARLYELAQRLRAKGVDVTILTGMPNYPEGRIFCEYQNKIYSKESLDGLTVIRSILFASKSRRFFPRLLSYLSFGFFSFIIGLFACPRQDIILLESPPIFLGPFGWLLSKRLNAKLVLMVSDIWPDILVRMGSLSPGPALSLMLMLEKRCYDLSDFIAVTNPGASQQLSERFPDMASKLTIISNGVDIETFSPRFNDKNERDQLAGGKSHVLVGYCGLHGMAQGLDTVVRAAKRLQDAPVSFIFIGDGPCLDDLKALSSSLGCNNITFFGRRPKTDMPKILASLDVSLVPLSTRLPGTMPSKIYEAFASGTPPIVAKGCEGEALVDLYQCGLSYEPGDEVSLAEALQKIIDGPNELVSMKKNCAKVATRFSRDAIAEQTFTVLSAIHERRALPSVTW